MDCFIQGIIRSEAKSAGCIRWNLIEKGDGNRMRYPVIKKMGAVSVLSLCILFVGSTCPGQSLKERWFFSFGYGRNRSDVEKIKSLVTVAADHGLNGMVLSSFGLDSITRWKDRDILLLKEVADFCRKKKIELIPTGFSVGYGGGVLGHDRSFAAALPASISLKAREGRMVPAKGVNLLKNGDLEQHAGNRFKGYDFHDQPGNVSFVDELAYSGSSSICFKNFGDFRHGHGRIMQKAAVRPGRTYRFSFRLRTQDLQPVSGLKAMIYSEGRSLANLQPRVESTQGWTEVVLEFINAGETEVGLYAGIWGGRSGKFWIDDLKFSEEGTLSDIVRRKGTPLTLTSRDRDAEFVEGRDFKPIRCLRELAFVSLPPGSSIREGEKLELSCYKIPFVSHSWGKQISLCMSNPKLYDYWKVQAEALYRVIKFKRILLSMDEIRNGGGCLSCKERGISMAEILGDCITRQHAIFKALNPDVEVMIWSDMLDPGHNARSNYYGVVGDFTGSWRHVPKDLTVMCWYHKIRDSSLRFFSEKGFRTFGASYYDADDLANPREWLASLKKTPNAQGIMYTTWQRKYGLLAAFGDLVSGTGN